MSENLKRHRPDIKVLGEGKAIAFMPEDAMGVWCHIQEVRDLLDVKDKEIEELKTKLETVNDLVNGARDMMDGSIATNNQVSTMRERRLRRALYKACANWAMNARMVEIEAEPWGENHESRLWAGVYDKCRAKAEQFKEAKNETCT